MEVVGVAWGKEGQVFPFDGTHRAGPASELEPAPGIGDATAEYLPGQSRRHQHLGDLVDVVLHHVVVQDADPDDVQIDHLVGRSRRHAAAAQLGVGEESVVEDLSHVVADVVGRQLVHDNFVRAMGIGQTARDDVDLVLVEVQPVDARLEVGLLRFQGERVDRAVLPDRVGIGGDVGLE